MPTRLEGGVRYTTDLDSDDLAHIDSRGKLTELQLDFEPKGVTSEPEQPALSLTLLRSFYSITDANGNVIQRNQIYRQTATPEPTGIVLGIVGFAAIAAVAWRRRAESAP